MIALRTDPTPGYVLRAYVGTQTHGRVANVSQHCPPAIFGLRLMAYFVNRRFVMGYARVTI